ncbi:MAG: FUSC family protein [Acidobacteriaceae bacterium]
MTATAAKPPISADPDHLTFHHGLRTALAAGLAYWFGQLLHLPGAYWAAISSIIVMQSEVGATVIASRDRFIGTAIGAIVGWLAALIWHDHVVVFALAVLAVIMFSTAIRFKNSGRLGGVTVAIIVLAPNSGPIWHVAIERFVEVSLGIVVSLGVMEGWTKTSTWLRLRATRA